MFLFPDASSTFGPKAFATYSSSHPFQIFCKSCPSANTLFSVLCLLWGVFSEYSTKGNLQRCYMPWYPCHRWENRRLEHLAQSLSAYLAEQDLNLASLSPAQRLASCGPQHPALASLTAGAPGGCLRHVPVNPSVVDKDHRVFTPLYSFQPKLQWIFFF